MLRLQPVILGTDFNAYGMARSFHEAYGVKSFLVGRKQLMETANSRIIESHIDPELLGERFADILIDQAERIRARYPDRSPVLIACSDGYVEKIIEHRDRLAPYFILPFVNHEQYEDLRDKEAFYRLCRLHGIAYPATHAVHPEDFFELAPRYAAGLGYPLMLKPSDGIRYLDVQFPGKRKVYVIPDEDTLLSTLTSVYRSSYRGAMLLQEYLNGADAEVRILTTLSDASGKVRLMALGRQLLEDPMPTMAGISCAILSEYNEELFETFRNFLESIGYVGFACIDLKYDPVRDRFFVLELNVRQGRNAYSVTGGGYNIARYLAEAFAAPSSPEDVTCTLAKSDHLWLGVSRATLRKHLPDKELIDRAMRLIRRRRVCWTLYYRKDCNWRRLLWATRYYRSFERRFE